MTTLPHPNAVPAEVTALADEMAATHDGHRFARLVAAHGVDKATRLWWQAAELLEARHPATRWRWAR